MSVPTNAPPRWAPFVVLGVGLLAISFGAILARLAQAEGVSSLVVASWRLGLAALIITPLALVHARRELRALDRRQLAELAVNDPQGFEHLTNIVKAA